MKYVKMLGPAALAVAAATAFLGASSASATVLCKTTPVSPNTNSCPTGWDYPGGTNFEATVENTTHLVAGSLDDTCTGGTIRGTTANTGSSSETVKINIATLDWSGCTCATETVVNGSFEIHWISGTHNGTLTGKNSTVKFTCFGVTCSYGASAGGTDLGKVTSSATSDFAATIDIEASLPRSSGNTLFCPANGEWTGNYLVTQPVPLYIAETP